MGSNTILLVEDNASDVELTRRALQKNAIGNKVAVAADGQEALDYLFCSGVYSARDADDMPALVLLDIKLPRIDGLEVLRRIRADARTRRIPVIMLTSSTEDRDISTAYDLGANSYIRKAVDFRQFSDMIRQLGQYWLTINQMPPVS